MLGKYFECEADKNKKYFRVIQTVKEYKDGRRFPIDKIVVSDNKINLETLDINKIGGFCISTYEYVFRWLIRGDTLCEVIIPEDSKVYKTTSKNGMYVSEKIILTNPRRIDDNLAMELYLNSTLPENSYFKAMTACAIMGYINTALQVCNDKDNKKNIDDVMKEVKDFTINPEKEEFFTDNSAKKTFEILYNRLIQIKNN